jgi:hypothetical protein
MIHQDNSEPGDQPAAETKGGSELRNAVRFPLHIPVKIFAEGMELDAMTVNISATGILFIVDRPLPLQLQLRFTMKMPAKAMGAPVDVVVHCSGRVVRCTSSGNSMQTAAMIDEYHFSQ